MNKIFEKLGVKKADEMERSIQLKSIRFAWTYNVLFLIIWSFYESYKVYRFNETINLIPNFLLVSQTLVLIFSQLFFRNWMVKGEDEGKKNSFWKVIIMIAIIAAIIAVLGSLTLYIIR